MARYGKIHDFSRRTGGSPDKRTVLRDGTARIFDVASGRSLRTFRENGWLSDASLALGDGKVLWRGRDDKALKRMRVNQPKWVYHGISISIYLSLYIYIFIYLSLYI